MAADLAGYDKAIVMDRRPFLAMAAGAAITWPIGARAQQKLGPVIGILSGTGLYGSRLQDRLKDAGYVERQNITIEYRLAQGDYSHLPAMAAELVALRVAVIAAIGTAAVRAAKAATSTIPIVFVTDDPVAEGLVAGLARPGGNLTGVSIIDAELAPKRVELMSELVPQAKTFALLVNPNAANVDTVIRHAHDAANSRGMKLEILKASNVDEIDAAFTRLVQLRADALIVDAENLFISRNEYVVAQAARNAVPTIYGFDIFAWVGGLVSYGPSIDAMNGQVGVYAAKILKGANPADLPVEQPTKFELAINLKTARALSITVPASLLARADEVIE